MYISYESIFESLLLPKRLLPVYSLRHHCSARPRPLLSDGKMATESCDAVNMDLDIELLSDEELERYYQLSSVCQRLVIIYNHIGG